MTLLPGNTGGGGGGGGILLLISCHQIYDFHSNHHQIAIKIITIFIKTIQFQISYNSYLKVAMLVAKGETEAPAVVTGWLNVQLNLLFNRQIQMVYLGSWLLVPI